MKRVLTVEDKNYSSLSYEDSGNYYHVSQIFGPIDKIEASGKELRVFFGPSTTCIIQVDEIRKGED